MEEYDFILLIISKFHNVCQAFLNLHKMKTYECDDYMMEY